MVGPRETPGQTLWLSLYRAGQYDQHAAAIAPERAADRMSAERAAQKWLRGTSRHLKSSFPEKLRRAREAAGLTQKQLSETAGLSATGLAMIERGERMPNLDTAARICWALDALPRKPDARWEATFPDVSSLEAHVARWPISEAVPERITDYLRVTRALVVQSYFEYEFALVASMWTMLALEATLRGCLDAKDSTTLRRLIDDAAAQGLLDEEGASLLHDVRKLRNKISHQAVSFSVQPEDILQWIGSLHSAISDIYTRAAAKQP